MDFRTGVTEAFVEPDTPDEPALIVVLPVETPVAKPVDEIVATAVSDEAHAVVALTSFVVPSL